jgi:hypothetical protein
MEKKKRENRKIITTFSTAVVRTAQLKMKKILFFERMFFEGGKGAVENFASMFLKVLSCVYL